jgi:putative DNA primase/helicase
MMPAIAYADRLAGAIPDAVVRATLLDATTRLREPPSALPDYLARHVRPTPLPVRVAGIPTALQNERRWVVWQYVWKDGKNGRSGKWDKPPGIATDPQRLASSTNPTTWGSFADALAAYHDGKADGIGFMLGDGWVGFDADDTDATDYISLLDTYTERSPSGAGVHAIARGTKPGTECRTGPYELYDHGRYFTVTGHHLAGTPPTVEERTPQIAALYARLFSHGAETSAVAASTDATANALADDALIAKARTAKNGAKFAALFRGDMTGYPSQSEADAALCAMLAFWTNRDAARMDRLFRQSGLLRPKWDTRRGDSTYGASLIAEAIRITPKGYTGSAITTDHPMRDETLEDLDTFLARMASQPELAWLIPGLIPDEGICLWHGQPRDFKSMCAQEVSLALAAGRPAFSIPRFATSRAVRVGYFTEEDPERLFAARMCWLTATNPRPAPGFFFPFVRRSLSFDVTEDRDFILRKIQETGADVVIFDPVRSYTGFADKGPAELRPVALFLRKIQNTTTAKTLLLVHHDTKPSTSVSADGQERSRSQQASGGGIFSISDCPVSFEKLSWNVVAVYPEDYKLSGNPKPFEVTFETDARDGDDGPRFGSWVRPVATTKVEQDITDGAAAKKILRFLDETVGEWHSTVEVNKGARLRKDCAGGVLKKLHAEGLVRYCTGEDAKALGRKTNAHLWSGITAAQAVGSANGVTPM